MEGSSEETPLISPVSDDSEEVHSKGKKLFQTLLHFILISIIHWFAGSCVSLFVYDMVSHDRNYIARAQDLQNEFKTSACGSNSSAENDYFQKVSSQWIMYFTLLEKGAGLPVLIIGGLYSDVYGRKPFFMLPMLGYFLKYSVTLIFYQLNLSVGYMLIPAFFFCVSGNHHLIALITMTTIADTTSANGERTFGFVILECIIGISLALCQLIQGYTIQFLGFKVVFIAATIGTILVMISTYSFVLETLPTQFVVRRRRSFKDIILELTIVFQNTSETVSQSRCTVVCLLISFITTYIITISDETY